MMASPTESKTPSEMRDILERELRDWWERKNEDWVVEDESDQNEDEADLWGHMPEIDSKAVTRAGAGISEEHLDIDFDPSMVQEGGYDSINELVDHLVPQLIEAQFSEGGEND
jgi:hypothetical protein